MSTLQRQQGYVVLDELPAILTDRSKEGASLAAKVVSLSSSFSANNFGYTPSFEDSNPINERPVFKNPKVMLKPLKEVGGRTTLIFCENPLKWDTFDCEDKLPSLFSSYPLGSLWRNRVHLADEDEESKYFLRRKEEKTDDIWNICEEAIEGIESTGGYDWWLYTIEDVCGLKAKLKGGKKIQIRRRWNFAETEDGRQLGFPPIHNHHTHQSSGDNYFFKQAHLSCGGIVSEEECYSAKWVNEFHGDYGCINDNSTASCWVEADPKGYVKVIDSRLVIEGEYNDVRIKNSPKMKWKIINGIEWSYEKTRKQTDIIIMSATGRVLNPKHWSTAVGTWLVPTNRDTFTLNIGRDFGGGAKVMRNKVHGHNLAFSRQWLFGVDIRKREAASRLSRFDPSVYNIDLGEADFTSIHDMDTFIVENLLDDVICVTVGQTVKIDGWEYDRRPLTHCKDFDLSAGRTYTLLTVHHRLSHMAHAEKTPEYYPAHSFGIMSMDYTRTKFEDRLRGFWVLGGDGTLNSPIPINEDYPPSLQRPLMSALFGLGFFDGGETVKFVSVQNLKTRYTVGLASAGVTLLFCIVGLVLLLRSTRRGIAQLRRKKY